MNVKKDEPNFKIIRDISRAIEKSKLEYTIKSFFATSTDKWYFGGSRCILGMLVDWEKISLVN